MIFPFVLAMFVVSCASPELPASSRVGKREAPRSEAPRSEAPDNAELRLPSQWGSRPSERRKWWQGTETRYPNSGYYSSEDR